jgi:hypothetical protein
MSDVQYLNEADAMALANSLGCTAVMPSPYQLQLDLDLEKFPWALDQYTKMLPTVQSWLTIKETDRWTSKSGRGTHIVLTAAEPIDWHTRLTLQVILGSDPVREFLALRTMHDHAKGLSYLFRPLEQTV